jgi:tight adherence protein B
MPSHATPPDKRVNPTLVILCTSLAGACFVWFLASFLLNRFAGDRQKLAQRLTADPRNSDEADDLLARNPNKILRQGARSLPPLLAKLSLFRTIHTKLVTTDPDARASRFLVRCLSVAAAVAALAYLPTASPLASLAAAAAGLYFPVLLLNLRHARRQRLLNDQLPEALDFLGRILRAGHSLSTGLQMMGDELPQPIGAEFRRAYEQHSLGQSIESALRDASTRMDSPDFAFFVTAVLIQRQTGGDLTEVLRNISAMVRGRIRLQQHVLSITAEGRFTGYILFCFPTALFFITYAVNPAYASVLLKTDVGRMLLAASFFLQVMGLMVIRKIVNVKA